MTSPLDAHAAHREAIRELSRPGGPLEPASAYASVRQREWFPTGDLDVPAPARRRLWSRLKDEVKAEKPDARAERRAIVLAGPPGAGKSTALADQIRGEADGWLTIDADDFKTRLLRQAVADGSYDRLLKPPEVQDRESAGEPFFPLELASLVHEESSRLADDLRQEAMEAGTNIVIDTVLSKPDKAVQLGRELAAAGYEVQVLDVEVPFEVSAARIALRWEKSYAEALEAGDGLGGRWVPSVYARDVFDPATGRTRSQVAAERLAETCPNVLEYRRFWTPAVAANRSEEVHLQRSEPGKPLVDLEVARAARVAFSARPRHVARRDGEADRGR